MITPDQVNILKDCTVFVGGIAVPWTLLADEVEGKVIAVATRENPQGGYWAKLEPDYEEFPDWGVLTYERRGKVIIWPKPNTRITREDIEMAFG